MRDEDTWIKSMANQMDDNFQVKFQAFLYVAASTLLNPFTIVKFNTFLTDQCKY